MNDTIGKMLSNHQADSWRDLSDSTAFEFDDERLSKLERLTEYVDYCFETYPVVSDNIEREAVQTCIADWGRRRGQARYDTTMRKREFGKQVRNKWRSKTTDSHAIFVASALIGVSPEEDNGVGWKPCVRHELGHLIDYEKRGSSDHGPVFKAVMSEFGEEKNDGMSVHGLPPRLHR